VSQAFAKLGYKVYSNDLAVWSETFGICYLLNEKQPEDYQELIAHLNGLSPTDGWFTAHYGGDDYCGSAIQPDGRKKPWQRHNTRKLDAIRQEIDRLELDRVSKAVALTSLILALDRVDNTLGHYVSYLKDWSPRSYGLLKLRVPRLFNSSIEHNVYRRDIFDLAEHVSADIAYIDPPYGSNNEKMPPSRIRYASYYHIWTTICLNDEPQLFGSSMRRLDTSDTKSASVFEDYRRNPNGDFVAVDAIERLVKCLNTKWIILSYSSGGRATAVELYDVLENNGKLLEVVEIDHNRNVMAHMKWSNQWLRDIESTNREFLFLIEKR
jgi:adenine-specific DNA-methyltransferase